MTTNEYILIIGSSGMMAYYMFGFLAALTKRVHMMFVLCCIFSLFETFLQTYFLIKLRRYSTEGQSSVVISSAGILIMIKNLMFWFLSSYNPYAHDLSGTMPLLTVKTGVILTKSWNQLLHFTVFSLELFLTPCTISF